MNTDPQRFHTITANTSNEENTKGNIKLEESSFKNKYSELAPISSVSP